MSIKNTNNRRDKYISIIRDLSDFFQEQITPLVMLAARKGANKREIADALGVDPSVVTRKYSEMLDKEEVKRV